MSLKAFHIVFVLCSTLLAVGFGIWNLNNFMGDEGNTADLLYAIGSFVAAVGLVVYGIYFLKKLKNISYL